MSNTNDISNKMLLKVLNLFDTMVEYQQNIKFTSFDHRLYQVLPTYFIYMANGSRLHSGFRLIKRCASHAMDSNTRYLIETSAQLLLIKSREVAILINNDIPVSMKSKVYKYFALLSASDLIACKYDYQYRSFGPEAVTCIHILPLIFKLTLLLVEGLAQNLLLKLCARIDSLVENTLSSDTVKEIKKVSVSLCLYVD